MEKAHFGMIGLGTMGRNFLLNVAEHGISGVGYDLDAAKRDLLLREGAGMPLDVGNDVADFLSKLESPRNIMLLVPAGPIVDKVIADLVPHLDNDDLIIDGGNSHFTDTERREAELAAKGIGFIGMGVSGGEEGARHGPSIMPGGRRDHYDRIEPTLQAVAAKVNGEPCVAYMGSGSAGHFVKMVHNGIEYGMMQLIAEAYDLLRHTGGSPTGREGARHDQEIAQIFADWNSGDLNSFLIEITATVLAKKDDETGNSLVSMILDTAGQKGTGKWTSQAAMDLGVPVPTIDSAVTMRQISGRKEVRTQLAFASYDHRPISTEPISVETIEDALFCGFLTAYSQGMSLLAAASAEFNYGLDLARTAMIWRGGCIIRSAMLTDIANVFTADPSLDNMLRNSDFFDRIEPGLPSLESVVIASQGRGIPAMCFSSALNYIYAFRTERLPANLIQAQRDYFGAHTYRRTDKEGTFHTPDWEA